MRILGCRRAEAGRRQARRTKTSRAPVRHTPRAPQFHQSAPVSWTGASNRTGANTDQGRPRLGQFSGAATSTCCAQKFTWPSFWTITVSGDSQIPHSARSARLKMQCRCLLQGRIFQSPRPNLGTLNAPRRPAWRHVPRADVYTQTAGSRADYGSCFTSPMMLSIRPQISAILRSILLR